jgi:hypothetical protein
MCPEEPTESCPVSSGADYSGVTLLSLDPDPPPADHAQALRLADAAAHQRLGEAMLLSWYDRDRDLEAPRHVSECHRDSAIPGYVDYALSRGATLRVDIGHGRFMFFYRPVDV